MLLMFAYPNYLKHYPMRLMYSRFDVHHIVVYFSFFLVQAAFKKYAKFFSFLLISIYNEFIFQYNLCHSRCTSPGGVSYHLYHF